MIITKESIMKIIKNIICFGLALLLLLGVYTPSLAYTEEDLAKLSTKYIMLVEASSGAILLEKDADTRAYPASTTKIMTCILALELGDLDEEITVGPEISRGFTSKSSLMGLRENETIQFRHLLYGMMLVSGNDAASAVAVHLGGTIEGFADIMNAKAKELGMTNTNFVNPHGVHKEEHYSTARDMATLAVYAMKNSDFRHIVNSRTHDVKATNRNKNGYHLENTNKLIYTKADKESFEYRYAIGIKTGDTDYAKRCIVAAAEKDGITLISVQLYEETQDDRFALSARLFDWGFQNFASLSVASLNLSDTIEVPVKNYSFEDAISANGGMLTLNIDLEGKTISKSKAEIQDIQDNISSIAPTIVSGGDLSAPIEEGELVAKIAYKYNGETLFTADAYASASVAEMGGGIMETPGVPLIVDTNDGNEASPWPFILLVLAVILILGVVIIILRNKNRRTKRVRRRSRTYRGRR